MQARGRAVVASATLLIASFVSGPAHLSAQRGDAALTGVVESQEEGKMEGVVVTARRDGANFDVSVVSDAQGTYSFPRTHLEPGTYALKIRAVGYDLSGPARVEVTAAETATADLAVRKTTDLSQGQLTSVEWLMSLPGPDSQKDLMAKQAASCGYCHNIERVLKTTYTAEQWVGVITRMQKYYLDGTAYGFEGRGRSQMASRGGQEAAERNPNWGYYPPLSKTDLGAYLASVNQSDGKSLPTDLKTLPRPTGAATRVIITQYDLPRADTVAHDADVDADGNVWYTDQSRLFFGRFDPKTATFKEWALPPTTKTPAGASDVIIDRDGNVWFPMTHDSVNPQFGVITKFDPRTETFTHVEMPPNAATQFMDQDGNGKIWSGFMTFYRIDAKTATFEDAFPWGNAENRPPGPHAGYQMVVDSKGNPYITDFMGSYIVKVEAATKEVKFLKVPTPDSMPRRGRMDEQDRFWFGEYRGDKIGMLDTRTETFKEWPMPYKYMTPYTASAPDARGRVYAPSNTSDRLVRLDPNTGETVTYLMPTRDFDTKKIAIDPDDGTTVWFANKRSARIVKVKPLD